MISQSSLIAELNSAQQQAVTAPLQHALVLAGAGSGKTRVLAHRVAWLVHEYGVSPHAILAVTFTNKAAREMRGRIETVLGLSVAGLWIGTFHGLAHRLLRLHWVEAGLPQEFQILDADDQYRLVRRILKELSLDEANWAPKKIQQYINSRKDEGRRANEVSAHGDYYGDTVLKVYQHYEAYCRAQGIVDFAELLLRSCELLRDNAELAQHYHHRFAHILVDEFQDTNTVQYAWLKHLAGATGRLMVVGDDDQSIYGWRGAKIENIQRFSQDYSDVLTLRLEQNYRSTGTILSAANQLIAHNEGRLGKELWTDGTVGEAIHLYAAFNEQDEAYFVVEQIKKAVAEGARYQDIAILYRSNAQSRVFEEALLRANVPYRIYGGQRFFERAEIKDALAYLRLVFSRDDSLAFERAVNRPTRGVGERTLEKVREQAREMDTSLWQAAEALIVQGQLPARASSALKGFMTLINTLSDETVTMTLPEQIEEVITRSGLEDMFKREKGEKAQSRLDNLAELVTASGQFIASVQEQEATPLQAFLAYTVLESGEAQSDAHTDGVQLMTLHMAKGLEFPTVFLVGLEEGLFPHALSNDNPARLQEERRLCYVGMTRAMRVLVITYAEIRRIYGREQHHSPSRFLHELPSECLKPVRVSSPTSVRSTAPIEDDSGPFVSGQAVRHAKFGEGVVLACEGQGERLRVQVQFALGAKWLAVAYANLETVGDFE